MAGGEVFISGRSKDIIIRAGRNLYPQELEDAVGNLAAVRNGRVAVFGATDKSSGTERLVVLAETRERQPASQQKLRAQINALTTDLTGTPADDVVLAHPGTVLKTSSGKIRRSASRALYERGELGKRQRAIWLQLAMVLLTSFRPALRQGARAALSWCYSVYAWTTAAIVALGAGLLVAVLPGRERRRATAAAAVRFLARLCAVAISVSGMENLPRAGRCVLVSNHTSYLDSLALIATLPLEFGFVAKAELTRHASLRFLLRRLGTEFVERFDKAKGIDDARHLSRLVGTGRALLFFPEGMLSRRVGLLPFQMGAFLAAAEASVPVVPVTIRGTRSILRADSWFPRHGRICLTISPPIETLAADTGSDMWARAVALRDTSRKEILRHCGEPDLAEEALRPEKAP
jgi:1-acyl-sn-glycerol-3-phosphate acyltransferase